MISYAPAASTNFILSRVRVLEKSCFCGSSAAEYFLEENIARTQRVLPSETFSLPSRLFPRDTFLRSSGGWEILEMLRASLRTSSRFSAPASSWIRSITTEPGIGGGSMGSAWKDRERAAEEMYFSKEDAATLSKLAKKLQMHTEVGGTSCDRLVTRQAVSYLPYCAIRLLVRTTEYFRGCLEWVPTLRSILFPSLHLLTVA